MNEEELQQIRDSRDTLASHPTGRMLVSRYVRHVDALLAEVERLRTIVQPGDHPLLRNMRDDEGESWHSDYDDFVRGMTPASARYVYDLLRKRLGE